MSARVHTNWRLLILRTEVSGCIFAFFFFGNSKLTAIVIKINSTIF